MVPEYPEFKTLELEDLKLIRQSLAPIAPSICELNPVNLFVWKDFDRPQLTVIHKNLCLLLSPLNEPPYFLEPLGKNKTEETVKICLNHAGRISRASSGFTPLRDQFDYIYSTKDLAELKGKKFDGKRNRIKQFKRLCPDYEFVLLKAAHRTEAFSLFEKWSGDKKELPLVHDSQKKALETAFLHFDKLYLTGGAIFTGGRLAGFIMGSVLNPNTADVHFQYGDPALPGISQTLLQSACQKCFFPYPYLNLEQDMGLPGLRRAKLSYHPLRLEKKFEIAAAD